MAFRFGLSASVGLLACGAVTFGAVADGGVSYTDIAKGGAGLSYSRVRSVEFATIEALAAQSLVSPLPPATLFTKPELTGGNPGVVIFDFDGDGDEDLYVTNGPGAANSLFSNQLVETGATTFVDVAAAAGIAAADQDSAGACAGDLDNDGDRDLVVLGRGEDNRLFENLGDGTFAQRLGSGVEGGGRWSSSCTLGDVDADGLLDLVVANSGPMTNGDWIYTVPFALNDHNQLFVNDGSFGFSDHSAAAGLESLGGFAPAFAGSAGVTWAAVLVDVDLDGDLDIAFADDQAAIPPAAGGGVDRGLLHMLINDGSGQFTDAPLTTATPATGQWMGLSFGDLNCDGSLDLFASNLGDFLPALLIPGLDPLGLATSRWMLGQGDGSFTDPGVSGLVTTPFGWGNAIFDYDNDGDLDILFHGGLDISLAVSADNPGALLQNQGCSANFVLDSSAFAQDPTCVNVAGVPIPGCTAHLRRNVRGVAVGDLDGNGFADIVTVADVVSAAPLPLVPSPVAFGSPFDLTAHFVPVFATLPDGSFQWTGLQPTEGDLAVELSSGNGNHWAAISVQGSIGLTGRGVVNRDGIGAVLAFTPHGGATVTVPVTAGSSHLSQHAHTRTFGLGEGYRGTLEILWPGGVRNRLLGVRAGERLSVPEIPCSYDADWANAGQYIRCVRRSLRDLRQAGVIDRHLSARLFFSNLYAFFAER